MAGGDDHSQYSYPCGIYSDVIGIVFRTAMADNLAGIADPARCYYAVTTIDRDQPRGKTTLGYIKINQLFVASLISLFISFHTMDHLINGRVP